MWATGSVKTHHGPSCDSSMPPIDHKITAAEAYNDDDESQFIEHPVVVVVVYIY